MTIVSIGYDGTVDEVQFAKLIPSVGASQYGVVGAGDWNVTAHPTTDKAVNVSPGSGWGPGVFDTSDTTYTVQCDPLASGTRWDLITARRDWQPVGGSTVFGKVTGGNVKDLPVRLTNPGVQDEQPLALIQWTAGQTQPTAIVDLRVWAGNGGMFAKDSLVRNYLTKISTEVTIGGVTWRLAIGANDTVGWEKASEIGKIPMFGVAAALAGSPSAGTSFLVQAGTEVRVTDNSGYARIYWPKPFPNGLLSIILTAGDDWANGRIAFFNVAGRPDVFGTAGYGNTTEVVYVMEGINGQNVWAKIANQTHRINYVAIGW